MGIRWYVAYPLSTRHVEELMEERGVEVDHSTINRWVIKYSPQLEEAFHRRKRAVWQAGIAAVAACPNITLKLGGLGMPRMGFDWHTRAVPIGSEALAADMTPWMQYCIEHFGPERCMFESNFPPDKVSFSHPVLYNAFKRFSKDYSPTERANMFHDTAVKAYRISYD